MRTAVGPGDVGDVTYDVDAGCAVDGQVGQDVDPPAATLGEAGGGGEGGRFDATAPDDAVRLHGRAVGEGDVVRRDLGDGDPQVDAHTFAVQDLGDVVVGVLGERSEQGVAEVDEVHFGG